MAKKRKLSQTEVLVLEDESFRLTLKNLGFTKDNLTPMEVYMIIKKAEKRLNREFSRDELVTPGFFRDILVDSDYTAPLEVIFHFKTPYETLLR